MEEVAAFVIQFFIEVVLQVFGSLGVDAAASRRGDRDGCGWLSPFLVIGGVCGGLSLIFAPHAFLPNVGLRAANLILAPVVAGGVSYLAAMYLWSGRRNPNEHFWHGFLFALGFGLVRFAYIHR